MSILKLTKSQGDVVPPYGSYSSPGGQSLAAASQKSHWIQADSTGEFFFIHFPSLGLEASTMLHMAVTIR